MATTTTRGALCDLDLVQGVDLVIPMQLKLNGLPVDLSTAVFTSRIVKAKTDTELATITVTVTDGPNGSFTVGLDKATIDGLTANEKYEWFLHYTIGGVTKQMLYGSVRLHRRSGS